MLSWGSSYPTNAYKNLNTLNAVMNPEFSTSPKAVEVPLFLFSIVTSFWVALNFLLLFANPTAELPTPSFDYHMAFTGIALEIADENQLLFNGIMVKPADLKFKSAKRLLFGQTTKDQYALRTKIPKQESTIMKEPNNAWRTCTYGKLFVCH
ncbi:hypothetical protein Tco_1062575 [Tanacetum coccineum]